MVLVQAPREVEVQVVVGDLVQGAVAAVHPVTTTFVLRTRRMESFGVVGYARLIMRKSWRGELCHGGLSKSRKKKSAKKVSKLLSFYTFL